MLHTLIKLNGVEISIGVYGGTFDPIHHGHLILAREALETLGLDRIIFVPAAASPHKLENISADGAARLEMLRAAIAGEEKFSVDESELQRPPPSFTIETIEALRKKNPSAKFIYLIGEDNVARLESWHRFAELREMVRFVVLARAGKKTRHEFAVVERQIEISATEIRNRVASGKSIRYLVPQRVAEIIQQRRLYTEPEKLPKKI